MKASIAGVSVRMPREVASAGTLPLGLILRKAADRCSVRSKLIRLRVYLASASSNAMCDASEQVWAA